jgi:hypothetical protein
MRAARIAEKLGKVKLASKPRPKKAEKEEEKSDGGTDS